MSPREKVIEKVKKLFALANSSNEHEAALAASKAMEFLAEHNLAMSDVEIKAKESADILTIPCAKTMALWNLQILNAVKRAFNCEAFTYGRAGKVTFVGIGQDVEVASYTYIYLFATVTRIADEYVLRISEADRAVGRIEIRKQQRRDQKFSFQMGCAAAIREKLEATTKTVQVTSFALVPIKDALIAKTIKTQFNVSTTSVKSNRRRDHDGYIDGLAAGAAISINPAVSAAGAAQIMIGGSK